MTDIITRAGGDLQTSPGSEVDTIRLSLGIDDTHFAWIELDEEGVDTLVMLLTAWKILQKARRQ